MNKALPSMMWSGRATIVALAVAVFISPLWAVAVLVASVHFKFPSV